MMILSYNDFIIKLSHFQPPFVGQGFDDHPLVGQGFIGQRGGGHRNPFNIFIKMYAN